MEKEWKVSMPYHSFEESKHEAKNKKFTKEKNVSPKERHVSPREKGMNDPSRRKIPQMFIVSPTISPVQKRHVVQHKKFPQMLTKTQKMRMQRQRDMEKRKLPEEMLQGKPKEADNLKEKVMLSVMPLPPPRRRVRTWHGTGTRIV